MKLLLKDLKPGDEFEYVYVTRFYRKGKFVVLNNTGSYLEPVAREGCAFIFSFNTNKVCQHWGQLDVNLISKTKENNMKNSMGHFEGWRFGVPVRVYERNPGGRNYPEYEETRLISEDNECFMVVFNHKKMGVRSKQNFHYKLIPYQAEGREPAYPVCRNDCNTAYCNARTNGLMSFPVFGGTSNSKVKPYSIATLNIDGKTIELSAETTAELKKKLRV